jgi:hypothetical protein
MAINWELGLQRGPDAGQAFVQSFEHAQQNRRVEIVRQALAALQADPNNQRAMAALAQADPETAMQYRAQLLQQQKELLAQHSDSILKGGEIIRQFKPQDQPSYSAALQAAQQSGIDISQVPQQYNPQYVQGVIRVADALKPQTESDIVNVPYQPGGGVLQINKRTGENKQLIVPNDGTQPAGSPVGAKPLTDDDILRMRGGQAGQSSPGNF